MTSSSSSSDPAEDSSPSPSPDPSSSSSSSSSVLQIEMENRKDKGSAKPDGVQEPPAYAYYAREIQRLAEQLREKHDEEKAAENGVEEIFFTHAAVAPPPDLEVSNPARYTILKHTAKAGICKHKHFVISNKRIMSRRINGVITVIVGTVMGFLLAGFCGWMIEEQFDYPSTSIAIPASIACAAFGFVFSMCWGLNETADNMETKMVMDIEYSQNWLQRCVNPTRGTIMLYSLDATTPQLGLTMAQSETIYENVRQYMDNLSKATKAGPKNREELEEVSSNESDLGGLEGERKEYVRQLLNKQTIGKKCCVCGPFFWGCLGRHIYTFNNQGIDIEDLTICSRRKRFLKLERMYDIEQHRSCMQYYCPKFCPCFAARIKAWRRGIIGIHTFDGNGNYYEITVEEPKFVFEKLRKKLNAQGAVDLMWQEIRARGVMPTSPTDPNAE